MGSSSRSGSDSSGENLGTSRSLRRWSNRLAPSTTEPDAPEIEAPPSAGPSSRVPGRSWGVVLAAAGGVVLLTAAGLLGSLYVGGVFGFLSAPVTAAATAVLALLGAYGLFQGRRAYRGR